MTQFLLMISAVLLSVGVSQRVLPKGYEFKCQPKEGKGILGVAEELSKLNEGDYAKMTKFDSLRKVAELINDSLTDLDKLQKNDAYKKLVETACSIVHVDLDFYMENWIEFYQFLLKEFKENPPLSISDDSNKQDFLNMTKTVLNKEREEKIENIKAEHIKNDKSVNESLDAIQSYAFNERWREMTAIPEVYKIHRLLESHKIPADEFFKFTMYYAGTFWKRSSAAALSASYILHWLSTICIVISIKLFKFKLF